MNKPSNNQRIAILRIVSIVASAWHLTAEMLLRDKRVKTINVPRQVAMLLVRRLVVGASWNDIGSVLRRDHSTLIKGVRKAETMMNADPMLAAKVAEIQTMVLK